MNYTEAMIPKYLDPDLPIDTRIDDLISQLTLEEKIDQLSNSAPSVPRLGIPAYNYWNESLHGVARNGQATVFPQAIAMAATWDPVLIEQVASAIGDEGRAKFHASTRKNGGTLMYQGLTFWSPNINLFRDPRWGRGQETFGEDPFLTGELGVAYVRGIQGRHPEYLKAAACAKHFVAHSGPENIRHKHNVVVTQQELNRTYLPAFKKLVTEAKVEIVMGAYNSINGTPCCANRSLLIELLRGKWGFDGHVVSDCGAIDDLSSYYYKDILDKVESAALALHNGCDLCCGRSYSHLVEAVKQGKVAEEEIDLALMRVLRTRFRLGMFDSSERNPYQDIPQSIIDCDRHRKLAYQTALKSIVLIKNDRNILPLRSETIKSLLVVGPTATSMETLLGNYHGVSSRMVTLLEGIIDAAPEGVKVQYRMGTSLIHPNKLGGLAWDLNEAKVSDVTIACIGITPQIESEEGDAILSKSDGDRESISLPANQIEYIKRLAGTGTQIVLCLSGGSPIDIHPIESYVSAIIMVWYPGEEGGNAVADILFGKVSPSGKLPVTFLRSIDQIPDFEDYSMAGRTYRFMDDDPAYPFGFGLSYVKFSYGNLKLSSTRILPGMRVRGSFTVSNCGSMPAEEVTQYYIRYPITAYGIRYQLVGFKRVRIEVQETVTVEFEIEPEQLLVCNKDGELIFLPGDYSIIIGGGSPGSRGKELGVPEPVEAAIRLSTC